MATTQDIGIRVVILGVGEARRSLGAVRSDLSGVEREIRTLSKTSITLGKDLTRLGSTLVGIGRTMTLALTTPLLLAGGRMIQAGIEFEDAFAGITKTVDGASVGFREAVMMSEEFQATLSLPLPLMQAGFMEQLNIRLDDYIATMSAADKQNIFASESFGKLTEQGQELRDSIRQMALDIPISAAELSRIGQLAGQLGVPLGEGGETLEGFIETIALLGVTTDLTTEAAAFAIARMGNIFGVAGEEMDTFAQEAADVIVHLGNTVAATEPEITGMALRIASAGRLAGVSKEDILALSATLVSLGVKSERGGTAVSRIFQEMTFAIAGGGEALDVFSEIAGLTTDEFQTAFGENALDTVVLFTSGLREMHEDGRLTEDTLKALGLSGVRVQDVLRLMGLAESDLAENREAANKALEEGIALDEEAAKRFKTTASQVQLLKNAFTDLSITVFDLYADDINNLIESVKEIVIQFRDLDEGTQRNILRFAALAAAAGPVIIVVGLFLQQLGTLITTVGAVINLLPRLIGLFVSLATSGLMPVIAAVGLVALAFATDFLGIRTFVQDVWQAFIDNDIPAKIQEIIDSLLAGDFSAAIDSVKKLFVDMWAAISQPSAVEGGFGAVLKDSPLATFANTLEEDIAGITDFLNENAPQLVDGLNRFVDGIKGFVENFTAEIDSELFSSALENIATALETFAGLLSNVFGDLLWAAGVVLPLLGSALGKFANALLGILGGASIGDILTDMGDGMDDLSSAFGAFAVGIAKTVVDLIVDLIGAVADLVGLEVDTQFVKDAVVTPFFEALLNLDEIIFGDGDGSLKSIISNIPGMIGEELGLTESTLRINLKRPFTKIVDDIVTSVIDGTLLSDLRKLPGRIVGALNGLWQALQDNLLKPFLDAINPAITAIETLLDAAGRLLGIGSGDSNPFVGDNRTPQQVRWDNAAAEFGTLGAIAELGERPEFARGGVMQGFGIVGEKGPELAFAKNPTSILPNTLTERILGAIGTSMGLQERLLQTISMQRPVTTQQTNIYSPSFAGGAPSQDMLSTNSSVYSEWLAAQAGV